MPTISFKADDDFYKNLKLVADKKGVTVSAYIKLNLKEVIDRDILAVTENGLTLEKEMQILEALKDGGGKSYNNLQDFFEDLEV